MVRVFVDTSALLAVLDEDDREHSDAADTFRSLLDSADLITHNYVLVECLALVRRRLGTAAVAQLSDGILPAIETIWVDAALHQAAFAAYRAVGSTSLVDHVSFEVACTPPREPRPPECPPLNAELPRPSHRP